MIYYLVVTRQPALALENLLLLPDDRTFIKSTFVLASLIIDCIKLELLLFQNDIDVASLIHINLLALSRN